jgi:DNA-binding MarR family transcriptional regulator/GNAT superfamily N-acetyltransferase
MPRQPKIAPPPLVAKRSSDLDEQVAHVRAFNRFYTRQVGALGEHLLDSAYSLAEVRVLYEIDHRETPTAAELARDLGLDRGYLSRVLRGLTTRGLIEQRSSTRDRRERELSMSARGKAAFATLDQSASAEIVEFLSRLTPDAKLELVRSMSSIQRLLDPAREGRPRSFSLRPPRAGELGWVVSRHGSLYAQEYGWGDAFEALVAEIIAGYAKAHDPAREAGWIADVEGEPVGSIFVMKSSETVAQLRLLLVEPAARGLGLGRSLIAETIRFSRRAGYGALQLWTQSNLTAARHLYSEAGFTLVDEVTHRHFGPETKAETWRLELPALPS